MLFCGVDIGTSNIKIALYDASGRKLYVSSAPTPRRQDAHGLVTDPARLVTILRDMIVHAWRENGWGQKIAAISSTGVGEDGFFVDEDLEPLNFAVPWFDQRAKACADELAAMGLPHVRSGIQVESTRTIAKWFWHAKHTALAQRAAYSWMSLTDYPLAVWSGMAFMSDTIASRTGAFDPVRRYWVSEILDACHSPSLPPVLMAGTEVGLMRDKAFLETGAVDQNTMLVAGGHDHPVAAHAIHNIRPEARVDSLGTANIIYADAPHFEIPELDPQIAFMASIEGLGRLACLGVFEFNAEINSFRGGIEGVHRILDFDRVPGEPGNLKGAPYFGARSVLEWSSFQALKIFGRLAELGVPSTPIYATGGWSRSLALMELRASMYGEAIYVPDEPELTVMGACLLAARPTSYQFELDCGIAIVDPVAEWVNIYRELALEAVMREMQTSEVVSEDNE